MRPRPNFSQEYRVYWEDTDAGGVVYYANHLKFLERCRTDWLRALGIDQRRLRQERKLQFAVVSVKVDYLRPLQLDDRIRVTATLAELTRASLRFDQAIWCEDARLAEASTRVACLDSTSLRPRAIPMDLFEEWRIGQ